jgi:hypothetical protein
VAAAITAAMASSPSSSYFSAAAIIPLSSSATISLFPQLCVSADQKRDVKFSSSSLISSLIFFLSQGKCRHCGKAFQSLLVFGSSKEVVGLNCSWCKAAYHNKDSCMKAMQEDDECDLGANAKIIVPPSW